MRLIDYVGDAKSAERTRLATDQPARNAGVTPIRWQTVQQTRPPVIVTKQARVQRNI